MNNMVIMSLENCMLARLERKVFAANNNKKPNIQIDCSREIVKRLLFFTFASNKQNV